MAVKPAIYSRASSALMSIPCFPITAASFSSYSGSASQRISILVPTRAGLGTGAQMRTALGWYTSVSSLGPRGGLSCLHQPDGCGPDSRKSSSVALTARRPARKKSSIPEGANALASRCGSGSPCCERYQAVEKFTSMIHSSFHTPTRLCRPTGVDTSKVQSFIGSIKGTAKSGGAAQTSLCGRNQAWRREYLRTSLSGGHRLRRSMDRPSAAMAGHLRVHRRRRLRVAGPLVPGRPDGPIPGGAFRRSSPGEHALCAAQRDLAAATLHPDSHRRHALCLRHRTAV